MSLELDITGIMECMAEDLEESTSKAKKLYVNTDTNDPDPSKMSPAQFKKLFSKDPTIGARNEGKYIQWMAKLFTQGRVKNYRMFNILKEFDDLVNKNKIERKNINDYDSLEDVAEVVHTAQAAVSEGLRTRKERMAKDALIKRGGWVQKAYYYVNRSFFDHPSLTVWTPKKGMEDDPMYITLDMIQNVHDRMAAEEIGKKWKNFIIDTDIFNHIKEDDKDVLVTDKAVAVKLRTEEEAKFYGRNPMYDPNDTSQGNSSVWCIAWDSVKDGRKSYWNEYTAGGDSADRWDVFYAILPKNIEDVPKRKYAKIMIQATKQRKRVLWDFNDAPLSGSESDMILKKWGFEWDGEDEKLEDTDDE